MSIYQGRTAIVTGAAQGIGRALAEALARRGTRVVITDVKAESLAEVAKGIQAAGGEARAVVLDVRDAAAVKKVVEETAAAHGGLDFIFNNAGIAVGAEAHDYTLEDWKNVIDVDFYGVVYGVAAAYPLMVKQGRGRIVNTASIEGLCPFPITASYAASKHAVVGLSMTLRIEGEAYGVKSYAVCPGYIKTRIFYDSKIINLPSENMMQELPDWLGYTPDQCAEAVMRGIEADRPIIVVTAFAKFLYALQRISPALVRGLMRLTMEGIRKRRAELAAAK